MSALIAIALMHMAGVISPGANFLIVTRNSLTYSRQSGLVTARGVALGSLTYIALGLLGFGTIIAGSPLIFNAIRLVGGAYFGYRGAKALLSLRHSGTLLQKIETRSRQTERGAFVSGLLTALSNPLSILYFLAMFTSFVPTSATWAEKVLTALVLIAISLTWYSLVALTFSQPRVRWTYCRFEAALNAIMGILWIALAIKLLTAH